MMALALLRIPIAITMGLVGFLGVAYLRDWNFAPALAMNQSLRDRTQLYPLGGAAFHTYGQLRHAGRHVAGAVPRGLYLHRSSPRRARHGDGVLHQLKQRPTPRH